MIEELIGYAVDAKPYECCGLIAADKRGIPIKIYPIENVHDDPENSYTIDPDEQLAAFNEMNAERWELWGIYHSHPTSDAYPSRADMDLSAYDVRYIIISLKHVPIMKAYYMYAGIIEEVDLGLY